MAAINTLRVMNRSNARKLPDDAPTSFLRKRWQPYVLTETGVDRHFYELAVLTELKNGLRAGDVWVPGSRQFKDFEEYLLGRERFAELRDTQALPVAINRFGKITRRRPHSRADHTLRLRCAGGALKAV